MFPAMKSYNNIKKLSDYKGNSGRRYKEKKNERMREFAGLVGCGVKSCALRRYSITPILGVHLAFEEGAYTSGSRSIVPSTACF